MLCAALVLKQPVDVQLFNFALELLHVMWHCLAAATGCTSTIVGRAMPTALFDVLQRLLPSCACRATPLCLLRHMLICSSMQTALMRNSSANMAAALAEAAAASILRQKAGTAAAAAAAMALGLARLSVQATTMRQCGQPATAAC
jgi:hypothetical protein